MNTYLAEHLTHLRVNTRHCVEVQLSRDELSNFEENVLTN